MNYTEEQMQIAVASYLDAMEGVTKKFTWQHTPNEGKRHPALGKRLKRCGLKPGQPDIEINFQGNYTIFIELKTKKNSLSANQKTRIAKYESLKYPCYVIKSDSPNDAVKQAECILQEHLGKI